MEEQLKWRQWAEAQAHADRLKERLADPDNTSPMWQDTIVWCMTRIKNIWWDGIKYSTKEIDKENYA